MDKPQQPFLDRDGGAVGGLGGGLWDARITTTAVLFFLYLGYLALRRVPGSQATRAKREGQLDDFVTGLLDALQHVQLEAS